MSGNWKVTLPCTRAEAEAIDAGDGPALDPMPTLVTTEEVLDDAEQWRLDAYFDHEPDAAAIAAIAALAPGTAAAPIVERLPDEDWVTMSQAGLAPLHVGRFFVHTGDAAVPKGAHGLHIAAAARSGRGIMRRPAAASPHWTEWRRRVAVSTGSSTSAPAPACSPSPPRISGPTPR